MRTAAPARLLPGKRWRGGDGDHFGGARARPQAEAGRGQGGGARHAYRPADHDLVLSRGDYRAARDGPGRQATLAAERARPGRYPDRGDLRPLHAVRVAAAGGIRLCKTRRGQGLHSRRPTCARWPAADQPERRPAWRGLHPRHERRRRGRAPGARQRGQPGRRRAQRGGHGRYRRADQRPDPGRCLSKERQADMFVDLTPEQHKLRLTVRDYFNALMTPELRLKLRGAEGGDDFRRTVRQMGKDGLLAVGWPRESGGQGYAATEQLIFFEEANIAGAPLPFVTISTVGPALMQHGTAAQKQRFLPGIAAGEIIFAIAYSEAGAGSDLAALKTRAQLEGDLDTGHFVVNGAKLWTSGAESADYLWLAARTSTELPRHKGISILIVDTRDSGFSHTLIETVGNMTAATYYDNVRVPADLLVGELHGGWKLITAQLNHERLGLGSWSDKVFGPFARVLQWAKVPDEQGRRAMDASWVRRAFAECYARLESMRVINFRIAADLEAGGMDVALASTTKVYGSESVIEILRKLQEIVGGSALVRGNSSAATLMGDLEYEIRANTINTFGGGTNEIQRELIAQFGLGLARPQR